MADAPKRPIVLRFVFGKGLVKRRKESEDTGRSVVEQVTIAFAQNQWDAARKTLAQTIESDVRAELVHVAGEFRRNVIGAPGNQRGLVGALTTVSKGADQPREPLGSLPRWAPRGARYLARKRDSLGSINWFDNTGWNDQKAWPSQPGLLSETFESDRVDTPGGGEVHVGSGGIFEDIFGGVSVEVIRNNRGWGINQGTMKVEDDGKRIQLQLGTIRVRALGKITNNMLKISDSSNRQLLDVIGDYSPDVALHLRGGRGRYRPTLEPYLKFFLNRAIPYAVQRRLARGNTSGRLFRAGS